MPATTQKTPGVYINEINAFPSSVVEVPTAIPAFIGYTPRASYQGKSLLFKPVRIASLEDFKTFFAFEADDDGEVPPQYKPEYYITDVSGALPENGDYVTYNGKEYTIQPDPNTIYYLYNEIQLFYQNGGGTAYIVSIGSYGAGSGVPITPGAQIVNTNVKLADLQQGLELLRDQQEPTIYVAPEATLLPPDSNGTLMQNMLNQSGEMQTSICIFDIIGSYDATRQTYLDSITQFRESTGTNFLKHGTAYFPFLITTITQPGDITYENLNGGDTTTLNDILSPASAKNPTAEAILAEIQSGEGDMTVSQYNDALIIASPTYKDILDTVTDDVNVLPPSGAMAGIYNATDDQKGVWTAPANVSPTATTNVTYNINGTQQEDLNVDALTGKSVNAIRFFNGKGVLVWGARTLDGNSQDWRYINVRRTMTFIEQSIKLATEAYVFAPNDSNTWASVKSMIENFLTNLWTQGALQGSATADAFDVSIGLGNTMTSNDILDGYMRVTVRVAVVRPAEFIILTFQQKMAES